MKLVPSRSQSVYIRMTVNRALYNDATALASDCNLDVERFMEEVIEAYVAERRLAKAIPYAKRPS